MRVRCFVCLLVYISLCYNVSSQEDTDKQNYEARWGNP